MRSLTTILLMIVAMGLNAKSLQFHVSVTNSWNQEKRFEPVVIKLKDVPGLNFEVQSATVFIGNHSGQIDKVEVLQNACQLDDWDGDQRADELVFMAEVKANASADYTIELFDDQSGDADFGKPTGVGDSRWV